MLFDSLTLVAMKKTQMKKKIKLKTLFFLFSRKGLFCTLKTAKITECVCVRAYEMLAHWVGQVLSVGGLCVLLCPNWNLALDHCGQRGFVFAWTNRDQITKAFVHFCKKIKVTTCNHVT